MKEIEVSEYEPFVEEIKGLIHKKQYRVLKLINAETINLYWEIGEEIHRHQEQHGWGKSIVQSNVPIGVATYQLSKSLPEGVREMLPEPEEIVKRLRIFEKDRNMKEEVAKNV